MNVLIKSKQTLSADFLRYWVELPKRDMMLFCYLLESLEGLGYHSNHNLPQEFLDIDVPFGLQADFEAFVSIAKSLENV